MEPRQRGDSIVPVKHTKGISKILSRTSLSRNVRQTAIIARPSGSADFRKVQRFCERKLLPRRCRVYSSKLSGQNALLQVAE